MMSNVLKALTTIASFNDKDANRLLEKTGSYSHFDEPSSTRIARDALKGMRRWRHKVRGTTYLEIGAASGQCSSENEHSDPKIEGRIFMVYCSADTGELHVRLHDEFLDGRFEGVPNSD